MRHPGAPSERELAERVRQLQAINDELLEALEAFMAWYNDEADEDLPSNAPIGMMESAIAKARGES